jgi:hypothetical protein
LRKVITVGSIHKLLYKIYSGDSRDLEIILISFQDVSTERKEGQIGQAIVFKDESFLDDGKRPIKATNNTLPTSKVARCKVGQYLAWPVYGGHDLPDFPAEFLFTGFIWPGTICDDQKPYRTSLRNSFKDTPCK